MKFAISVQPAVYCINLQYNSYIKCYKEKKDFCFVNTKLWKMNWNATGKDTLLALSVIWIEIKMLIFHFII